MLGDGGKANTLILVVALALVLGIPVIGALAAARLVLQWFVF
jgi:hypothetical protein